MQLEHAHRARGGARQRQCALDPLGGDAGDPDQLLGRDLDGLGLVGRALPDRVHERQVQQVHLQADLVGDPDQRRVRERAEVDVAQQRPGVVRGALVGRVDRVQLERRGAGLLDDVVRRQRGHRRVRLVDDHRPRAGRVAAGRHPRRAVHGPHLRLRVRGDRGGVEGRVLDVVAHRADVVLAHRLDVHQRAAVVELEGAVPAVLDVVPEVHELRGSADVELQALEDRDHVGALVAQRLLHPPGVDRAGPGPLLDRDLRHLLAPEGRDAPGHAGAVDQLADQQELRHESGEVGPRQAGVAAGHVAKTRTCSSTACGVDVDVHRSDGGRTVHRLVALHVPGSSSPSGRTRPACQAVSRIARESGRQVRACCVA